MGYILPLDPYPYSQYVNHVASVKRAERSQVVGTHKIRPLRLKPEEMYERSSKHRLRAAVTGKGRFIDYYC